jgi:hypothetical protein
MAEKKKRDALAGVNMAMALDSQSEKDLAQLMKRSKKPGKIRTKPVKLSTTSNSIQKPGAFGIQRNDIMKARFGGKVVQKMQSGGEKLSQAELEAAIRAIEEQGNVFGKGESLSPSQTKKIADKFEADFTKMFGKKYGGVIRKMRKGGLMEAIEKVKAKGMKEGGDVPMPKPRPESLKADKTESLNKNFSKKVAKQNEKNVKKMELGGEAVPSKFKGFSKLPEGVQQKIDPKLASKYEYGGKVKKMKYGGVAKGGKMGCRGMGAALRGGGFSIR